MRRPTAPPPSTAPAPPHRNLFQRSVLSLFTSQWGRAPAGRTGGARGRDVVVAASDAGAERGRAEGGEPADRSRAIRVPCLARRAGEYSILPRKKTQKTKPTITVICFLARRAAPLHEGRTPLRAPPRLHWGCRYTHRETNPTDVSPQLPRGLPLAFSNCQKRENKRPIFSWTRCCFLTIPPSPPNL